MATAARVLRPASEGQTQRDAGARRFHVAGGPGGDAAGSPPPRPPSGACDQPATRPPSPRTARRPRPHRHLVIRCIVCRHLDRIIIDRSIPSSSSSSTSSSDRPVVPVVVDCTSSSSSSSLIICHRHRPRRHRFRAPSSVVDRVVVDGIQFDDILVGRHPRRRRLLDIGFPHPRRPCPWSLGHRFEHGVLTSGVSRGYPGDGRLIGSTLPTAPDCAGGSRFRRCCLAPHAAAFVHRVGADRRHPAGRCSAGTVGRRRPRSDPCPRRLRVNCTRPSEVTSETWWLGAVSSPGHSVRRRSTRSRLDSSTMSMKSMTMMPPMSRSRSWRTISSAASRLLRGDGLLQVATGAGELARVDVDHGHRLGAVDHQRSSRRQPHLAVQPLGDQLLVDAPVRHGTGRPRRPGSGCQRDIRGARSGATCPT